MTDLEFLESLLSSSNSDNTEIPEEEAYDNSMFVDAAEEGLDDNAKFLASLLEPDVPIQEEPERGFVDTIQRDIYAGIRGIQDGLNNIFSSDVKTASNWDFTEGESGIYSIFQNVGRWGITGALAAGSAMTGGLASAGLGALSKASLIADTVTGSREVYKGIYEDALGRGLSESDASNSAAWGTAMSMPFELIGDAYMAKVFGKANAKRIERKLIASGAVERVEDKNAIRVLNNEVAESIFQEEAAGIKKTAGLLPAPAKKEVAEEAADEVSDFISLSDLKEKFPISETIEKVKGKIPTKEEWETLKSKITDVDILEKFKNKLPTKEEWEALKTRLKDGELLDKIKEKIPSKDTWEEFTNKIKGRVPTKEEWEVLKTKLTDSEVLNKIKGKIPTKEEWESIVEKLKGKIPTKEELKAFADNSAFKKSLIDSYNKTKQFAKDTASTISAKKAEFIAARQAAQKANLHIKNPELYKQILKEAEKGRGWRDLFETAVSEGTTEGIQGRLENLGVYKNDPNMKFEDIFEGTAQDILLGAAGAGVLHGIAKGIGKSPIGKFSARRIAEMHRRRFDMGDVFEDLPSNKVLSTHPDFQDDFYKAHAVFDADTGERVDWDAIQDDGQYNITYQDGYAARNISGTQAKKYAEKVVKLRVDPETKAVVIPADIEFKDAPGTLTVSEDGTTTITPDYESLSDDPVKAEEQAIEQTEKTRAAIMRDEGVSEKDVDRQSPMPGAANRETFGKLSEGSDIQDDITDKPDTVSDFRTYNRAKSKRLFNKELKTYAVDEFFNTSKDKSTDIPEDLKKVFGIRYVDDPEEADIIQRQYEHAMGRQSNYRGNVYDHLLNRNGVIYEDNGDYLVGQLVGDTFIGSHFAPKNIRSGMRMLEGINKGGLKVVMAVPPYQGNQLAKLGFNQVGQIPQYFNGDIVLKNVYTNNVTTKEDLDYVYNQLFKGYSKEDLEEAINNATRISGKFEEDYYEDEEVSNYITRKVDKETSQIVSNYKAGKPKKGAVSKNHVMSAIVKFAKKALDINIDPTIKTEGNTLGKPAKEGLAGQVHSGLSILKIRDASDARSALHELAHYLFNRGRRLTNTGFRKSIGRVGTVSVSDFVNEMVALYNGVMQPTQLMQEHPSVVPATTTWDEWTTNESDVAISKYPTKQIPEEIFVEAFARYVADQGNFRQQFEQFAPKTYRAFQDYLTKRNLHDAINDVSIVYKMYAEQDVQTRQSADTNRQRPTLFQKIYDYIQEFIGDRQHVATVIAKTIDNVAGLRHIEKELEGGYKKTDRFERIRGHAASAIKAFISGNGLRFGGGDLLGSRFRNYESILRKVQTLSTITKPDGSKLTGVERFDAYLVAKNTVGETVGNTKTMHEVEQIAYDLGQDLRTTHQDIITIKRTPNYDWSNSKYAPYRNLIEHFVRSQAEWKQTPMSLKEAYDIIETEEVSPDFNVMNDAFNDYQYLWKAVQDYVSAMSPSMEMYVNALRAAAGAYYTPLMRELISNPSKYNAVITEREGSDRPSYSSIENTSAEIEALVNAGLRAYTKDLLVSMAKVRDSGVYIQEVLPPQEALSMEQIKEAVKKAVYKSLPPGQKNIPQDVLDALDTITVSTIFITNPNADVTGNYFSVISRNSRGAAEMKFYKADPALLQMLSTNGDVDNKANYLLQGLNYFNQLQKNWFTRYSLRFIFYTNPIRDAFTASFRGNRLLFKTGNKYLDNNWLNAIAGSLQGMSSTYMMWLTNPEQWQQYEDAMSAIGLSTNQLLNEYNAILSRTKPSTNVPQGSLGFLTSPKFKKFLERVDASDLIVRISELEYLLKDLGVDVEELYLSKDRVNALCLSKNKLESLGLTYSMIENVLTNDQRTIWNNTNSSATLSLNLTEQQINQIENIVKNNNVRTDRAITDEQLDMLNREIALCTTDFLRHGKWSDKLNILMLFSRAGINGTAQMATWIDRRKMQGRSGEVYGKIASAAILGWLYTSLFGDDDEDEEEMWNSLRFKFGDMSIDLPVLPEDLLGWNMGKALANGDINGSFVKHFAASINPIKSAGFAGLIADLVTDKKVSRVGWDDFASPIVPPYLKQKYGDELDKIVTYNTGVVARALPNIFGMTPAHWQYVLNNMGFGKLVKSVENSIGVDKSVLLPDGSIIPTGHGSLDYVAKQVGINKPLYKTRYERKLDDLFKEVTTEHSMNPDDEDAKARYLLLYNAVHLQQNLNKLKFFATTPEQHKRLVAMVGATAKNSYETITGGNADLYQLRAANKAAKAAKEEVVTQLKSTGEGTPADAYEKALAEPPTKRPKKEKKK